MYNDYFGIAESPFSLAPDPSYLYMSEKHQAGLAHLLYGARSGGGFVLLTGEVGTGKTTLCRCLLEQLPENVDVALCLNPTLNKVELLATILDDLKIRRPTEAVTVKHLIDLLSTYLLRMHARDRTTVLVIDEAQNLRPDVLELIRLLTNLETTKKKLLQVILVGQPELNDRLDRQEMRQLAQRITARYHLLPLTSDETEAFVRHRLSVVGLQDKLFTPDALTELHAQSHGIPRLINIIADRCLLGAYTRNQRQVDRRLVRVAAREVLSPRTRRRRVRATALRWAAAVSIVVAGAAFAALDPLDLKLTERVPGLESAERALARVAQFIPDRTSPHKGKQEAATAVEAERSKPEEGDDTGADQATQLPQPTAASKEEQDHADSVTDVAKDSVGSDTVGAEPVEVGGDEMVMETRRSGPVSGIARPAPKTAIGSTDTVPPLTTFVPLSDERMQPAERARTLSPSAIRQSVQTANPADPVKPQPQLEVLVGAGAGDDFNAVATDLFATLGRNYARSDGASLCEKAESVGLACVEGTGGWPALRKVNQRALIELRDPDGVVRYAAVLPVEGNRAILDLGGQRVEASGEQLNRIWDGDYVVIWKPPYAPLRLLGRGMHGADVAWLKRRLAALRGTPVPNDKIAVFDAELEAWVREYQRSRALKADGIVGPRTLIQLGNESAGREAGRQQGVEEQG